MLRIHTKAGDLVFILSGQLNKVARQYLGSLDKVARNVRLGVSLAITEDCREHPKVADGASDLLQDIFGKDKNPSRLINGVGNLPLGTPVALELIFEVA